MFPFFRRRNFLNFYFRAAIVREQKDFFFKVVEMEVGNWMRLLPVGRFLCSRTDLACVLERLLFYVFLPSVRRSMGRSFISCNNRLLCPTGPGVTDGQLE